MSSSIGNVASMAARGVGSVVCHVRAVVNPVAAAAGGVVAVAPTG